MPKVMAKDPAFLFYTSDFLTGTMLMSDEQVGKYIRLLCLQHQTGRLSEKHMLSICKAYDEDIFSKFKKDSKGLFYNVRLEDETTKRAKFAESRRNNAKGKRKITTKHSKAYAKHMEDVNEDEIVIKKEKEIPTYEDFKKYGLEKKPDVNLDSLKLKYDAWVENGWKTGLNKPIKNWKTTLLNTLDHLKTNGTSKDKYAIDDSISSDANRMNWD